MSKQLRDVYIVAATRTPIGKSGRGVFKNTRPETLQPGVNYRLFIETDRGLKAEHDFMISTNR